MQFNYELNPDGFRCGMLIRHVGLPVRANGKLITPRRIVWWWPVNWFWVGVSLLMLPYLLLKNNK